MSPVSDLDDDVRGSTGIAHDAVVKAMDVRDEDAIASVSVSGSLPTDQDAVATFAEVAPRYCDDAESLGSAVWEWRFHFEHHWGDHAVDALRALQRACTRSKEPA